MATDVMTAFGVDPSTPRSEFLLNGIWEFQPGGPDRPAAPWSRRVQVPGLVDLATPEHDWRTSRYYWHRRTFAVEAPARSGAAIVTIEQAMFGTEAWLNGRRIGGDIACYTSQEYDVTGLLERSNELLVRVGARETLPPENAAGNDQERADFIPGIWGDVRLTLSGNPRISRVQVLPRIETGSVDLRITAVNSSAQEARATFRCMVRERISLRESSPHEELPGVIPPGREATFTLTLHLREPRLWSPDDPFLYQVESTLMAGAIPTDQTRTTFGMREFTIRGADFFLNGRKIYLRGGNIAFHRFLSAAERRDLPWNLGWARRLLIDIPKAHNFNFFRSHIGQMYNRWYDIADEHGMLLQNEWPFWTTSGSKEQISREFTRWLQDNWNHPSIVIWDPLNECSDAVIQREIVPEMKKLDPTRPWESVDFVEQHPYIYSLGPVLVGRKFGYTEALETIENSATPSVVNEFLWWWLDSALRPTLLTGDVIERWLGPEWTESELIERQSFLAQELVELFRRMNVKAIQPFVYLSNSAGPTGNWFVGDIAELRPKPLLAALRNAFAPFGLSLELWDRHFFPQERRSVRTFVFNDGPAARSGTVRYGVCSEDGGWISRREEHVDVPPAGRVVLTVNIDLPPEPGTWWLTAELAAADGRVAAVSRKVAHVCTPPQAHAGLQQRRITLLDASGELTMYVRAAGIAAEPVHVIGPVAGDVLLVDGGLVRDRAFQSAMGRIDEFLHAGGTMIVLEPEFGVTAPERIPLAAGIELAVEPRNDTDKGGYDSYVFAGDTSHPLWREITREHLKMFNGGFGGEAVSEHHVAITGIPAVIHARCGLQLKIPAVFEIQAGGGRIIVSRLQLRGRLMPSEGSDAIYARRPDPVLQRYLLNLLAYASHTG